MELSFKVCDCFFPSNSRQPVTDVGTAEHSMSDIPLSQNMSSPRKRTNSHQAQILTPPRARQSVNSSQQAVISAYLRCSYNDDDVQSPIRLSSPEHRSTPPSAHHTSQGEIRRISGNFNAPTHIELERHNDHKKGARAMGKLKSAIRGLVRA